jgi:hypothetical protein
MPASTAWRALHGTSETRAYHQRKAHGTAGTEKGERLVLAALPNAVKGRERPIPGSRVPIVTTRLGPHANLFWVARLAGSIGRIGRRNTDKDGAEVRLGLVAGASACS